MSAPAETWMGIDLGTSSVKVVAVDSSGSVVASAGGDYPLHSPQAGWVEQSPDDWWRAVASASRQVVEVVGAHSLRGVGLSGQMHGLVALDRAGEVIRDAILWNDNRNEAQCRQVLERVGGLDSLLALTNNPALTGFTVGKILWMREHEPENFASLRWVLNPKDYLRWKLTGERVTDVSDASGTGLFDVRERRWSQDLLAALELDANLLPSVAESSEQTGLVTEEASADTGIPRGVPVAAGGGDAVLQTTSMGIVSPGAIGATIGTAGIVASGADRCPENPGGRVQVSCGNSPGLWHVMGVSLTAGGVLPWLANALSPLRDDGVSARDVARLAEESPPGSRGLRFLPYLVGERCPHPDPEARGTWAGLDIRHDVRDLVRSTIEGVLFNLRQVRDLFASMDLPTETVRISGGAAAYDIWTQALSDIYGAPVHSVSGGEHGAAYGAALLAGVSTGVWADMESAVQKVEVTRTLTPREASAHTYETAYREFLRLHPALERIKEQTGGERAHD